MISVRSTGKPYVSYSRQTSLPPRVEEPDSFAAAAYFEKRASPRLRVRANEASSSLRISTRAGTFLATSGKMGF
jgi:hypothetical protein